MERTALACLLVLLVTASVSVADIFEITYDVTLDEFFGPVFGESQAVTVTTTFTIDTAAAPAVILPSGTGSWTGPTLYGYSRAAISGLSVTFGTQTWNADNLNPRIPEVGFVADVWFDAPLADGGTPETWMHLSSSSGYIQFGGGSCGMPCFLADNAEVVDDVNESNVQGSPMNVTVSGSQTTVEYVGQTQCNASDSGFDATNATSDSPWLSVAKGQTTQVAKAEITPAENAGDVEFESGDSGIATVNPAIAESSPQTLQVKGKAAGETLIGAVVDQTLDQSLNVTVYIKRTVAVTANIIQLKQPNGTLCNPPKERIKTKEFSTKLNRIWDQSGVDFTVKVNEFFGKKAISADDNGNCILDEEPSGGGCGGFIGAPELQKIIASAKDPKANVNIYLVENYSCPLALYVAEAKAIFGIGFADQSPQHLSTELLMAHELGHHLDLPHCDSGNSIDNNCGGEGNVSLMHRDISFPGFKGCILHKPEWKRSNTDAASGG